MDGAAPVTVSPVHNPRDDATKKTGSNMANLNSETLSEMVKLKFSSRKAGGPDIDLVKLATDAEYAHTILSAIEKLPFESLVLLSMTLRVKLGLMSVTPAAPARAVPSVEKKNEAPPQRYMSGARS